MKLKRTGNMANKLRKMLDPDREKMSLVISFDSSEAKKKFMEACELSRITGQEVDAPSPKQMTTYVGDDCYRNQIASVQSLKNTKVKAKSDNEVRFPISVDGRIEKYFFRILEEGDLTILKSVDDVDIADITITADYSSEEMTVKWRLHPDKAETFERVIHVYKRIGALIDFLYVKGLTEIKKDNIKKEINKCIDMFEKAESVSKKIGKKIIPSMIVDVDDGGYKIAELYQMFVKNDTIKQYGGTNEIKYKNQVTVDEGQEVTATYIDEQSCDVFGDTLKFYRVGYMFGAIVDRSETTDGRTVIYLKEDEARPMYLSYRAFISETEAKNEYNLLEDKEKREEYKSAKTMYEQLS